MSRAYETIKRAYDEGYNKAIDDFFDELQRYEDDDWLRLKMLSIYDIAEQLKERGSND